ncbi:hypothetical protein Syn7502_01947 [Synechococcus sp. PCC 7502]|nr:hypothetical protein [Synechococcus sp. PCC 7502]AFY73978.1 hypothetical protein Syn7502_01947 [Synechococcus sp. PCC 7502]
MKSIQKALKKLGEIFNRVLDALLEQLGGKEPEPEMIPIPVRDRR